MLAAAGRRSLTGSDDRPPTGLRRPNLVRHVRPQGRPARRAGRRASAVTTAACAVCDDLQCRGPPRNGPQPRVSARPPPAVVRQVNGSAEPARRRGPGQRAANSPPGPTRSRSHAPATTAVRSPEPWLCSLTPEPANVARPDDLIPSPVSVMSLSADPNSSPPTAEPSRAGARDRGDGSSHDCMGSR